MVQIQNPNGSSSSGSSSSAGRRKSGQPVEIHDLPQTNKDNKKMWLILGCIVVGLIVAVVVAIAVTQ